LTEELARDLEADGFSVWWDTSLLPADDFRDEIDRRLDQAKAVVIIWTQESVHSKWVRAEADHADRDGKLVNTHTSDLNPRQIPKPFNQTNSAELSNRAAIIAAVEKLGARRSSHPEPGSLYAETIRSRLSDEGVLNAIALEHWQTLKGT